MCHLLVVFKERKENQIDIHLLSEGGEGQSQMTINCYVDIMQDQLLENKTKA